MTVLATSASEAKAAPASATTSTAMDTAVVPLQFPSVLAPMSLTHIVARKLACWIMDGNVNLEKCALLLTAEALAAVAHDILVEWMERAFASAVIRPFAEGIRDHGHHYAISRLVKDRSFLSPRVLVEVDHLMRPDLIIRIIIDLHHFYTVVETHQRPGGYHTGGTGGGFAGDTVGQTVVLQLLANSPSAMYNRSLRETWATQLINTHR